LSRPRSSPIAAIDAPPSRRVNSLAGSEGRRPDRWKGPPWRTRPRIDRTCPTRTIHSLAITRSERFNVDDFRVCELAVAISEAQRREIDEMDWLIDDINENGPASTREEAEARPVPTFEVSAETECDPD